MLRRRVNGYDMAYIELGEGPPLVCVHGTLGDFRVWSPVLGPLSRRRRIVALSLRHFFPEHWDGTGSDFTIAQHVADVIGFIRSIGHDPSYLTPIAERVRAGDIDKALMMFSEVGVGPGSWRRIPATVRQTWRDNAHTLLGQVNEQRPPFTRKDAESIRVPTLFVSGTETPGNTSKVLQALIAHVPAARVEMMSRAGYFMFEDDPERFCAAVMRFLVE